MLATLQKSSSNRPAIFHVCEWQRSTNVR